MRVVALVESEEHVCCRYRVTAFGNAFAAAGHHLVIRPLPRSPFGRLTIGRDLADAEVVIVQRKLLPRWTISRLRRRVRRLIFDFDDAVWLRDSYSARGFDDHKLVGRFRTTVASSDMVVAGNEFLAAEAAKHTDPSRVVVIPTCVESTKYPVVSSSLAGLQLVWIGSQSTLRGLERFKESLSAIGQAVPGTRLKLICDRFLSIANLPIDECPWREETEATDIASADVGISWIPDDPWSRGKCGLKILQYQAAGLPVIANPVGVHPQMVRDFVTGFLATTTGEWISAVERIAADPVLRERLGSSGREQVESRYGVGIGAALWLELLQAHHQPLRKSG